MRGDKILEIWDITYDDDSKESIKIKEYGLEGPFSEDHYIVYAKSPISGHCKNIDVAHSKEEGLNKAHRHALLLKRGIEIIDETGLVELVEQA